MDVYEDLLPLHSFRWDNVCFSVRFLHVTNTIHNFSYLSMVWFTHNKTTSLIFILRTPSSGWFCYYFFLIIQKPGRTITKYGIHVKFKVVS